MKLHGVIRSSDFAVVYDLHCVPKTSHYVVFMSLLNIYQFLQFFHWTISNNTVEMVGLRNHKG